MLGAVHLVVGSETTLLRKAEGAEWGWRGEVFLDGVGMGDRGAELGIVDPYATRGSGAVGLRGGARR